MKKKSKMKKKKKEKENDEKQRKKKKKKEIKESMPSLFSYTLSKPILFCIVNMMIQGSQPI